MTIRKKSLFRFLSSIGAALVVILGFCLILWLSQVRAATITVGSGGDYATIQAAIDAASPGDTIQVQNGTFNESLIITKSVTLLGGYEAGFGSRTPRTTYVGTVPGRVIDIQGAEIEVTIDGFEIAEGTIAGDNGGGIHVDVEDDSRVTIHDNFIHDNSADNGGGIYADVDNRSNLHITGNDVMTNTTTDDYAGLYANVYLSGTLTLADNDVVGNESGDRYGGLYAYVESLSRFTIEDNLVMSNTTAVDGDPLAPRRYYGGLYFEAEYNSHGTFDRNQVIGNYADDYYGGGYVEMYYNSSTTFYDNEFRNNTANYQSNGGLYLYAYANSQITGDNLVLADNTVNNGTYNYGGGYIYANYNSTIDLPHTRITGNRAGDDTGGVYLYAYDHSTITATNLYVYDNVAGGDHGGVSFNASDGNDTIIATNAQVISNTASGNSGGGYAYASDGSMVDLTGSRFERNTAGDDGGGLYVSDIDDVSSLLLGQAEFLTNTAASDGGGIYFSGGPEYGSYLSLSHARFISNTAESGDGGGFYMDGIYYNEPTTVSVQADHMTFERNTAGDEGGGFYLYEAYDGPGQLVFDDGVYRDNKAGVSGGGIYWYYCTEGCQLSMSRNLFEGNEATSGDGGGLHFYETEFGAEIHFDDNQFLNNRAGDEGGGFYNYYFAYEGSLGTFDRNLLRGNTAGGDGGGFYSYGFGYDGSNASFDDNVIVDNTSDGEGGGVYMYYPAYYATLTFNRNVITGNLTTGGGGGGLYMEYLEYGARAEFKENVISQNVISSTSSYQGGGIYLYTIDEGATVWMTGNEINDNIATGDGGGFYVDDYIDYGSVWYFEDNELQRNWAGDAGGGCYFDDYWYDGAVVHFNRNLINDNTALGDYGGCRFYDIEYAEVDFIGNQANRNTAGGDYGGLYFESVYDGAVMRFWDNQIIGNRAGITETARVGTQIVDVPAQVLGGDYGGLYIEDVEYGGVVDFRRNQVLSNTAYRSDTTGGSYAGMYADLDDAGLLTMVDNTIADNQAQDSLSGFYAELYDGSRLVMEHNLIRANTAITGNAGIYIKGEDDSQYFLERNRVLNNTAGWRSGGVVIDCEDLTEPLWGWSINNLIADNAGGSQLETGVFVDEADFRSLNDTIANNGESGIYISGTLTTTAYVSNTILWGHTEAFASAYPVTQTMEADYSDIQLTSGTWPGTGNINQNPLFVGGDDYRLQETSPAVDAADTTAAPVTDLDGAPRPVPAGGDADMGCYEWRLSELELAPDQSGVVAPGQTITYTLVITNAGNAADILALDVFTDTRGWVETIEPATISLGAGAHATINVVVSVPAGTAGGANSSAIIRVASQMDPDAVASVTLDTAAANVADLALSPDHTVNLVPGLVMRYEHTIANDGNFTDSVHLTARSSQGWATEIQPVVDVPAGGATTVVLSVTVPGDAPAGTVDTTVLTATSATTYGVTTDSVVNTGTVLQFASVSLEAGGAGIARPNTTITYTHIATNAGNGLDILSFSATSSLGWGVSVTPESAAVPAGTSTFFHVAVTLPALDGDVTDVTTVTVRSTFNRTVLASIQDTTSIQSNIYLPLIMRTGHSARSAVSRSSPAACRAWIDCCWSRPRRMR